MPPLSFPEARGAVLRAVSDAATPPPVESVPLTDAASRILAEPVAADRDCPALSRSVRDGFAIRSQDAPGRLLVAGEVRAGQEADIELLPGQAVEIMTGAPIPPGADAVVMVEHTRREGDYVIIGQPAPVDQFINPKGCEAEAGQTVLQAGKRLDYADIGLLASFGHQKIPVFRRIEVAILATGDEVVAVDQSPADYQVRNSNTYSLAAQVARAGAIPRILPVARDTLEHTRESIGRGLECDLLLLSGGVSAGKYDVVEEALATFDSHIYFDRVLIQPGQPLVFGRTAAGRFFFGLPGNPSSTMVTFELFARAAIDLLSGASESPLHMPLARLTRDFSHRVGLTRFLPAQLSPDGAEVTPVQWHGSGDIPALTRANAYLVTNPERAEYPRGDLIRVLPK